MPISSRAVAAISGVVFSGLVALLCWTQEMMKGGPSLALSLVVIAFGDAEQVADHDRRQSPGDRRRAPRPPGG